MIIRTLAIALASLLSFSATTVIAAEDAVAEIDNIDLFVADNPRKDRRDDRQEKRPERRDDRQDCRQDEGRVGDDKRECKQDERGEGVDDDVGKDDSGDA
jgi:hypothetical protein